MKTSFLQKIQSIFFDDKRMSWFWLIVRVYLGWQWLYAGYEKIVNPAHVWVGEKAGVALTGFLHGALAKTAESMAAAQKVPISSVHADVSNWYAYFLSHAVLPNAGLWSQYVAYGEVLVGLGLIFGALTFLAAFFGFFMNLNYLLAGTVSTNPQMLILALLIMLAHKTAGLIGFDHYIERAEKSWALFRWSFGKK